MASMAQVNTESKQEQSVAVERPPAGSEFYSGEEPAHQAHPLLANLHARNLLHNVSRGLAEYLHRQQSVTFYCGFDPTAPSLHVGSLIPILSMIFWTRYGHQPIVVIGGGTALIGDPSGKDAERPLLPPEQIEANSVFIQRQIQHLFRIAVSPPRFVNNAEWLSDLSLLRFLRDVGKHIPVNIMLDKESVRRRLVTGISFTEFAYMLLQAYDFLYLFRHYGCTVQMGGSDQWGNITLGIELIRRQTGQEAYGWTTPLLTRADGSKFGKTASGESVWLDPQRTPPYAFYQFWIRVSDADVFRFLRMLTLLPLSLLEEVQHVHGRAPERRFAQHLLALYLTGWVHSIEVAKLVAAFSQWLFSDASTERFARLFPDRQAVQRAMDWGCPIRWLPIPSSEQDKVPLLDWLVQTGILSSKAEGKRLLRGGALRLQGNVLRSARLSLNDLSPDIPFYLLEKGKKERWVLIPSREIAR